MPKAKRKDDKKAKELLYRQSLSDTFQSDLVRIRKRFAIPRSGFNSAKQEDAWFEKLPMDGKRALVFALDDLCDKHKLPPSARFLLEEKVLCDNRFEIFRKDTSICDVDQQFDVEKRDATEAGQTELLWRGSKQPYVKLFISDQASIEDVQAFVKDQWKHIQALLKNQRGGKKKKRIRISEHKKRDEEIFKLWLKPRKELGLRKGEYREIKIAQLLKDKYKDVTSDVVKSVVSRQKKLKKGTRNTPD